MKNLVSIALLIGVTALIFSSCGKYEEGPAFSLASKKGRVANEWVQDKVLVNGEEQEASGYEEYYITVLEKDGTGKMKVEAHEADYGGITYPVPAAEYDLEWEFDDSKEKLRSRQADEEGNFPDYTEEDWYTILKLKSKEMWLKKDSTELHLIQK